jgi:hypothetical protein
VAEYLREHPNYEPAHYNKPYQRLA